MKTNLIKIDFTTPTALNMDDQVSLRDIHTKLVERGGLTGGDPFANWIKEKLAYYTESIDFFIVLEKTKSIDKNGRAKSSNRSEYFTTVQAAMEASATLRSHLVSEISL